MQTSRRPQRLALQIQEEMSSIISRNLKDPRIGLVTVTGVDLSPDLRYAKIFISSLEPEEKKLENIKILNHAAGWIRRELGQRIRMKFLPEISFVSDTSAEYGERIDKLLDQIKEG